MLNTVIHLMYMIHSVNEFLFRFYAKEMKNNNGFHHLAGNKWFCYIFYSQSFERKVLVKPYIMRKPKCDFRLFHKENVGRVIFYSFETLACIRLHISWLLSF